VSRAARWGRHLARAVRFGPAWAADYAYAAAWQARAAVDRTAPDAYRGAPTASDTARQVLLIPGVYETWQFLRPVARLLRDHGHEVHVLSDLRRNTAPIPESAQLASRYLDDHDLSDVVVVAHSKGGLIGKHLMVDDAARGEDARVRCMVAISTPFSGSPYARLVPIPNLRMFSPSHAGLRTLAANLAVNARITSVYGRFDPHIPDGSRLDGAHNVELPSAGHFRILSSPRLLGMLPALVACRCAECRDPATVEHGNDPPHQH
jgi:hypothetical protein